MRDKRGESVIRRRCVACKRLEMTRYEIEDRGHDFGGIIRSGIGYMCGGKEMGPVEARKEWCGRWMGAYGKWNG